MLTPIEMQRTLPMALHGGGKATTTEVWAMLSASFAGDLAKAQELMAQRPELAGLFSSFQVSVPQIDADVDRERAKTYGVNLSDVFETLQVYLGSLYVNDFNLFGRTYQVTAQADANFRREARDILEQFDAENTLGNQ